MENIWLCDIDGTLASHDGIRNPYDESKVLLDKPLPTCEVIESLLEHQHTIIFLSGRTDRCMNDTKKWLSDNISYLNFDENSFSITSELYMRKTGDNRPDEIIKEEIYNTYIKDKYNVLGVFDDRLKVCRMWYKLGLFVFNCNQGLKEF